MSNDIKQQFADDVANHKMTVELNTGVHRCLLFNAPQTSNHYFRITTWPSHLCISGDMGCFVFERMKDMFDFFSLDRIEYTYWSSKLVSGEAREYCVDKAKEIIADIMIDIMAAHPSKTCAEIAEIESQFNTNDEVLFWESVGDITEEYGIKFQEWVNPKKFTYHYQWVCNAIVWAIGQYNQMAPPLEPTPPTKAAEIAA